jgi:inner membrane protein
MENTDPKAIVQGVLRTVGATGRLFVLGVLVLVMLIPLWLISGTVGERFQRSMQVQSEIAGIWGGTQTIAGPMLTLPYIARTRTMQNGVASDQERKEQAHFLPEALTASVHLKVERRYKSLYEVPVYSAEIEMTGRFAAPDFSGWSIADADVLWSEARLSLGISDMTGIQALSVELDGKPLAFAPAAQRTDLLGTGAGARIQGLSAAAPEHSFAVKLSVHGTDWLRFLPAGKETTVTMEADWPHPGFGGAFLPAERTVRDDGFSATWHVSYLARSYPQSWRSEDGALEVSSDGAFGVELVTPGDAYQQTDRLIKYGILVIVLTFTAIFLVGLKGSARTHFVQYLLVGASLCLFYLLVLSLSEHVGFGAAYAGAAVLTVAINALYVGRTVARLAGSVIAALLAGVYAYMYVLLRLEDYSLLVGTLGLLAVLVAIMYVTRNVDWYALGRSAGPAAPEPARGAA